MNGDYIAALRTGMLFILILNKPGNAVFLDKVQIVFHAHSVIFSISIINTIDLFARILAALETEGGSACMINSRTLSEQIGTPLVSRPAADALASF